MFQNIRILLYKFNLYNLSLIPLYVIFILQYLNIESFFKLDTFETKREYLIYILKTNYQVSFFAVLIIFAFLAYFLFKKNNTYGIRQSKKFKNVNPIDFDHLTFLSTYIIPLITFNLNDVRSFFIVIFLLLMIGTIYLKSNLYYLNPTLLLFGYKIYKAKIETQSQGGINREENVILISRLSNLNIEYSSKYVDLGSNIYFLKDANGSK